MSLPLPLEPETIVGEHYIIGKLINRGGFGAVYQGIDTSEGNRPCAIKETYDVTPAARRQALLEASILFTIKSKNLPQVYDAFDSRGRFYLVMQLIEGQNLLQLLKSRGAPCSEQEVTTWFLPIMRILQELHGRNPPVIHRDIKPGNIILTPDQTAVLVDFGLTKLYDPASQTQTIVKAVSEGFSPIEQYLGRTGPQSDIYSLGATMYFLLTYRLPPPAINRSMRDELVAPRQLNPALSLKMERVLLKALAVNADERYQSMREFIRALETPAFQAHAAPTIAQRQAPAIPPTALAGPKVPPDPYVNLQGLQSLPAYRPSPPVYHPPVVVTPPGYVMVHQSALLPVAQPLPGAFGQGCLWGLLQGLLSALLVLLLKKDVYFYIAIFMGFGFYVWAGFMTTRKGGKSLRGGWAGLWAGITGTIIFWTTFLIGLLALLSQIIQADSVTYQRAGAVLPPDEANRAWNAVLAMFPSQQVSQQTSQQSSGSSVIIVLAVGALLAFGFGWLGGLLGRSRHRQRQVKLART